MAEPFVAPLPIVAPVPLVPAPFVAPVHVNPVIVPLEEADAKTKIEQKLKEMQKKAHKAVEKAKKEAKKEKKEIKQIKKEIKNTKMEELPARPVVSLPSDELTNEVLLGLDKIKASSVNLAAQLKNTIELHAHDVAKPMLEGLFDIAKTSAKIASHMKDLKTQGQQQVQKVKAKMNNGLMLQDLDLEKYIELLEEDLVTDRDIESLEAADNFLMEDFDADAFFLY